MLAALSAVEWDQGNDHFPPTSFQLTHVEAGAGATNVIPGELRALANFRFNTEQTAAGLQRAVETHFADHGLAASIDWKLSGLPFLTARGALISACETAIKQHTGRQPLASTGGGTSDGRFIAPTGAEVIELGPLNATIHQVDECVAVDDLITLRLIYASLIQELLG